MVGGRADPGGTKAPPPTPAANSAVCWPLSLVLRRHCSPWRELPVQHYTYALETPASQTRAVCTQRPVSAPLSRPGTEGLPDRAFLGISPGLTASRSQFNFSLVLRLPPSCSSRHPSKYQSPFLNHPYPSNATSSQ